MIKKWIFWGLLICLLLQSCTSPNGNKIKTNLNTICIPNIDSINVKYFENYKNYTIINEADLIDFLLRDSVLSSSQFAVKISTEKSKVILPVSVVENAFGIPLSADYHVNVFSTIDSASFRTCGLDTLISISLIKKLTNEITCDANENNELFYSASFHQPLKESQLSLLLNNIGDVYIKSLNKRISDSKINLCMGVSINELDSIFKPNMLRINLKRVVQPVRSDL